MTWLKSIFVSVCMALVWLVIQALLLPVRSGMWVFYFLFDREAK